jgi:tetrapyrrole methylase family protein/MazG family protein
MTDTAHYGDLLELMRRLRGPGGCPWDREQTHETLRSYLLEEAYEALDAIDRQDWQDLGAELGDVLLQVVFHAQIAAEAGHFTMADVCRAIVDKLVHRHPHVFGDEQVEGAGEVLSNWEQLKRQERSGTQRPDSALDGIPAHLPALLRAQRVQGRAARVGFDWDGVQGPLDKVEEEFAELRREWQSGSSPGTEEEFGDLLFAMVNVARFLEVDAEGALRQAATKFERRFRAVEAAFQRQGRQLAGATLADMDALWEQVKREEPQA